MFARLSSPFLYALLASTFFVATMASYAVSKTNCPVPCHPSHTPVNQPSGSLPTTTSEAQQVGRRAQTDTTTTSSSTTSIATPVG